MFTIVFYRAESPDTNVVLWEMCMLTDFITGWNLFDLIYGISSQTARKLSGDATPRTAGGIQGSH